MKNFSYDMPTMRSPIWVACCVLTGSRSPIKMSSMFLPKVIANPYCIQKEV